ncbi:MAG: hypothetical protein E6Q74_05295 [Pseudoxanthomonas sp.]|nr:MAG: hypothetical protein E6Q74_05295 [Pseudoxanthomonas sp.]
MAQTFVDDFSALPTGWTPRWNTTPDWTGANPYPIVRGVNNDWTGLSIDAIDSDADRDDVELYIRFTTPTTLQTTRFLFVRGAGADESATNIHLSILVSGHSLGYCSGSDTRVNIQTHSATYNGATLYHAVMRVVGTALQTKIWADGASEPGSWQINTTNPNVTGVGWVGLCQNSNANQLIVHALGIGTNGDAAPRSAPAGDSASGGSQATVTVSAAGSGAAAEVASGGSASTVHVAAAGAGFASGSEAGGSQATVEVSAAGAGVAAEVASGGSASTVHVVAIGAGVAAEVASGGSASAVEVSAAGAGVATETAAGGSASIVEVVAVGAGSAQEEGSASGGSASTVEITTAGAGTAVEAASGGSASAVHVTATGAGVAAEVASGGSSSAVEVASVGGGAAQEEGSASGGSASVVTVTSTGGGYAIEFAFGGSQSTVTVTATGAGQADESGDTQAGGSTSLVAVLAAGAGYATEFAVGGSSGIVQVRAVGYGFAPNTQPRVLSIFERMSATILRTLGKPSYYNGSTEPVMINIEHDVQMAGMGAEQAAYRGDYVANRDIATVPVDLNPRVGDRFVQDGVLWRLESLHSDKGANRRFVVSRVKT